MILPNLANAAMGLKLKSSQKKSTAVGSVPPHSHDSSKDSGAPAPPPVGNITGNTNQNSKIAEIGKKFFQGDQFANQYASKPPVDPAMPVPPQPDPINDQYGNMFMQPFNKKVKAKLHKQKPALQKPKSEQFKGVNLNGEPKRKGYEIPLEGVQDLQDMGAIKVDDKGAYVVNEPSDYGPMRETDTLRLPKKFIGQKGQLIDETDYHKVADPEHKKFLRSNKKFINYLNKRDFK